MKIAFESEAKVYGQHLRTNAVYLCIYKDQFLVKTFVS